MKRQISKRRIIASKIYDQQDLVPVNDWRMLSVGDELVMVSDDFDGRTEIPCTVADILDDCAVAVETSPNRPMELTIDDDTYDLFYYVALR